MALPGKSLYQKAKSEYLWHISTQQGVYSADERVVVRYGPPTCLEIFRQGFFMGAGVGATLGLGIGMVAGRHYVKEFPLIFAKIILRNVAMWTIFFGGVMGIGSAIRNC